jgi:hypothetical protein
VVVGSLGLLVGLLIFAGWLLRPSGGARAVAVFGSVVALVSVTAVAAGVVLVRRRPARRVVVATIAGIVALLCCGLPAGGFWTFAVNHGPSGETCPSCAVIGYFSTGPLGGYTTDRVAFEGVLCGGQRGQLESQAEQIASDVHRATAGTSWGLLRADSYHEKIESERGVTTLTGDVVFTFVGTGGYLDADAHNWTFTLRHHDGWQDLQRQDAAAVRSSAHVQSSRAESNSTDNTFAGGNW